MGDTVRGIEGRGSLLRTPAKHSPFTSILPWISLSLFMAMQHLGLSYQKAQGAFGHLFAPSRSPVHV